MKYWLSAMMIFACIVCCQAAPPEVPAEMKVRPGQVVAVTVKTDKKIGISKNFKATEGFFGELVAPAGQRQFMFQAPLPDESGKYTGKSQYVVSWWTEGELEGVSTTITVDVAPPTPPIPPGPVPPTPTPPTPAPKGFRVIFVYETSKAITPAMQQVMFGEKVRSYLDTKTIKSGNQTGWRRFDPDIRIDNEKDTDIKAIWQATRPHITNIPCVVVAADSKVEILDMPASEDDAILLFKKYGG